MSSNMKRKGADPDRILSVTNFCVEIKSKLNVNTTDKIMKKLSSAVLLIAGAIFASQSARAQFTADDLYMGFENAAGGGTSDYIFNLGGASSIIGGSSVVSITGFNLSDFDSVLGSSSSVMAGVVGGNGAGSPTSDLYVTQLRTGEVGMPSLAGSSLTTTLSRAQDSEAADALSNLGGPPETLPGVGGSLLDTNKTWETYVEPSASGSPQSELSISGINPDSSVSSSGTLYEDLWSTTSSTLTGQQPFTYLGYFTVNPSDSTVTFTPEAVPEPGTAVIAGVAGLSLLILRRRYGKNA